MTGQHLVLYDGVCGLCNRVLQLLLPRDTRGVFVYASLQSQAGRAFVERFGRNPDALDTFCVVMDYRTSNAAMLTKSAAALFVLKTLGAPWSWLQPLGVLPRSGLDALYDLVARNRYRLFGRYDTCVLPKAEWRKRFIDS